VSCSSPPKTRFVYSLVVLAALLVARPVADETTVGVLAAVLAAADARRFDPAPLRDALSHASPAVRRQGALAAGRIGDPTAVDLLLPALNDSAAVVQAAAAFALGLLKDARAIPALTHTIGSVAPVDQGAPQLEAVTAIAKIGGDDGARALRDVIASGAPTSAVPVVNAALLESWRLGTRAPIADLVRFTDATDAATRWRALYSLARLRAKEGAAPLVRALSDPDPQTRTVAARGINRALLDSARLDAREAIVGLRRLLDDPDAHIRINALRSLASFRDSGLARAAVPLLADRDIGVQVQAETTLGVLRGGAALAALRPRLTSSVFALRRQALLAIAQADSAAGIAAALPAGRDGDWRWRSVAAESFGAARARDRLEAQLADTDGRVVAQALQMLQRIVPADDSALVSRARGLLSHPDPAVRSVAADLVARHPSIDDVDLLVAAYKRAEGDPFNDARLSAISALGAIAGTSSAGRVRVAAQFVSAIPRPDDYLVRRLAADTLPDTRDAWGPVLPIATGRTPADYREIARRWLVPALEAGRTNPHVFLETDRGRLDVELLPAEAPVTVAVFLGLVERRFFDGLRWHRVVPNFVVQDGDPRGDGWGGPGPAFVLRDEVNPIRYETGSVGMALSGPNTGSSQYFITHSAQPHLDGIYTIFGRVVGGVDVLNAIGQGDRIRSIHR
jgi:cyclophilin family peptidyl-prolyl cis-trans isomerase/HEAT repeat protein